MKISDLEMDSYMDLMNNWLYEKYNIDGWGEYYQLKINIGWSEDKIYYEFEKLYEEFEKDYEEVII